jgi:FkbM family methyltransferase
MESALRCLVRRLFAKAPKLYLATLKALRRGSHEKRMYLSIIRKGDVVIDVGANVGYFTMLFSDLVGPGGEVHAFEPLPSTFELLSRNIHRFPAHENVSLNCLALGECDQKTILFIPNEDHGQAALARHRDGSWTSHQIRAVNVEMMRLDRYAERLPKIDFVKCDAEGAELLILRGAESTLRRCRPKIFLEIEECWTSSFGWTPADVVRFLRKIGYQHFYGLANQGLQIKTTEFGAGGILCTWEKISELAQEHS